VSAGRVRRGGRSARAVLAAAGMGAALGGCGLIGAGSDDPSPRSAVEGIVGRVCRYVSEPGATPSIEELTRIGTRGNISLWGRAMGPADSVQLSIRYADDGRIQWVEAFRSTVDLERVRALERLLLQALDETGPADWGVRVLVVGGDVAGVAPSVICDPQRRAGPGIWATPPSNPEAIRDFYRARGRSLAVQVALDQRGRVEDVRLLDSTHSTWVDQYVLDYVRNSSFEPKLHDGLGVASVFEFQLRFRRR
jgi:TonB family protein